MAEPSLSQMSVISIQQDDQKPTNDAPNPYHSTDKWGKLPAGRTWGALNAVGIDRDRESVWVADRCGSNPETPPGRHRDRLYS